MGGDGISCGGTCTIKNLVITHNGNHGVFGGATIVQDVTVQDNDGYGIYIGGSSRVINSSVTNNGKLGIAAGDNCTIEGNEVRSNQGTIIAGIQTGESCSIIGNAAFDNVGVGIDAGPGSVVKSNVARQNSVGIVCRGGGCLINGNNASNNYAGGISAQNGSTVSDNVANENLSTKGAGFGISAGLGSTVIGNTARLNDWFGLSISGSSSPVGYAKNVFTENNGGNGNPQVNGGLEMDVNICGTDITCP